jgi:hypothetical protein
VKKVEVGEKPGIVGCNATIIEQKRETERREPDTWKDGKTHEKLGEMGLVQAVRRHPKC